MLEGEALHLYAKPADHAKGKAEKERFDLTEYTIEVLEGSITKDAASERVVFLLTALPETKSYSVERTVRLRVQPADAAGWHEAISERCSGSRSSCSEAEEDQMKAALPRLVFFVGGVTYAELAALRTLTKLRTQQSGKREQTVVITTSITNGQKILQSLAADFLSAE